jgi:hypothetical protein
MKKTAAKHSHSIKFDPTNFFTKNIGIMGLIVVIMFFIIYLLSQRIAKLEQSFIELKLDSTMETSSDPELNSMPVTK